MDVVLKVDEKRKRGRPRTRTPEQIRENRKEYFRQYYLKNAEKIKSDYRKYYARNPREICAKKCAAYAAKRVRNFRVDINQPANLL